MLQAAAMLCPECGRPMEHGYLGAESFIGGAKWTHKRSKLGASGPTLVKPDVLGNVYFEGFRCASCRHLSLHY